MSGNVYALVAEFERSPTKQGCSTFIKGLLLQLIDAGTDQAKLRVLIKDLQSAVLVVDFTSEPAT